MTEHDIRAVFTADGAPNGFFDAALDPPERIPVGAVAISDADWRALLSGGKRWNGVAVIDYIPPPLPVDLVAYAKAARDAKELGGITVQGVPIATDDRSKVLIAGARDRAIEDSSFTEAWSATDGKTYVLPAAVVLAVSRAVGTHVSEVFKVFADVKAHLSADPPSITTTAEIDAEFAAMNIAY